MAWELLHAQFGAEYSEVRNFQQAVRKALLKIRQIYPDLILGGKRGGIQILPGSLPVIMVKD